MRYLVYLSVSFIVACSGPQEAYWADEFEGSELSSELWNYDLGDGCPEICGWGNEEEQVYTRSNHRLEDGYLIITARKSDSVYTSTRITTQGKMDFQYGRLEARAKIPTGKGVWPAIWMLGSNIGEVGWPRCGEIDVLEYVGKEPGRIFTTLHTSDSYGNSVNTKKTGIPDIEEGFHIYAMEWDPEKIRFFVDGELLYTFAPEERTEEVWPFDQPFYLILNLAIGGKFGGPEIDDSIFPQEFIIDYVRIFKQG
ncbi:MAG: glycoside hydrolase family 16 protein [Robiginitalea sp.]